MGKLLWKEEVFSIIGAAMEVHCAFGPDFLEAVNHEALEMELAARGISFESQKPLAVWYKGQRLTKEYMVDLF